MLAILCSGQGTQHPGMFSVTGQLPEAEPLFGAAAELLGDDPRHFVQQVDHDRLFDNDVAQILCVTQAMAAYVGLQARLPRRLVVCGYSVGELAAWGVSGLLTPENTIRLAKVRAQLMTAGSGANDGLGFARGLSLEKVQALALRHGVDVAIENPDDMTVVGGEYLALKAFCAAALEQGAERADLLGVRVASHTSRLSAAVPTFRAAIDAAAPQAPRAGTVLISAHAADPVFSASAAADALASEIGSTLHWKDCLQSAYERGVRVFLELGPGRALANMASKAFPDSEARSVDDFHSVDGIRQWLEQRLQGNR